jgi:hypothetical protein
MHFDDDFGSLGLVAKLAAWFWLAVYVVIPAAMAVLLVLQERSPGTDPPPRHPIPAVLRVALALESVALLLVGAFLFVDPTRATSFWPWTLSPFTGRVVASWLIAFGLATAMAALGGDLRRLRAAAIAYAVFGVLVLGAMLRFPGTVAWGEPSAWILLTCAAGVVATGTAGWRAAPAVASDD